MMFSENGPILKGQNLLQRAKNSFERVPLENVSITLTLCMLSKFACFFVIYCFLEFFFFK